MLIENFYLINILNQKKSYKNIVFNKKSSNLIKKVNIIKYFIFFEKSKILNNVVFYLVLKQLFLFKIMGFYNTSVVRNFISLYKLNKFYFLNKINSYKYIFLKKINSKKSFFFFFDLKKLNFFYSIFIKNYSLVFKYFYEKKRFEIFTNFDGYSYYWGSHYFFNNKLIELYKKDVFPVVDYWEVFEIEDENTRFRLNIDNEKVSNDVYLTRFFSLERFDYIDRNFGISDYINLKSWKREFEIQKLNEYEEKKILIENRVKKFNEVIKNSKIKVENKNKQVEELSNSIYRSVISRYFCKKNILNNLKNIKKNFLSKKESDFLVIILNKLSNVQKNNLISLNDDYKFFINFDNYHLFLVLSCSLKKFNILKNFHTILYYFKKILHKKMYFNSFVLYFKNINSRLLNNSESLEFLSKFKELSSSNLLKKNFKFKKNLKVYLNSYVAFNEASPSKIINLLIYLKYSTLNKNFNKIFYEYTLNFFFKKSYKNFVYFKNDLYFNKNEAKADVLYFYKKWLKYKDFVYLRKETKIDQDQKILEETEDSSLYKEFNFNYWVFNNSIDLEFFKKKKNYKKVFILNFKSNIQTKLDIFFYYYYNQIKKDPKLLNYSFDKGINISVKNFEIKKHFTAINFLTTTATHNFVKKFIFSYKNIFLNIKYFFSYMYESSLMKLLFLKCNQWKWINILLFPQTFKKKELLFFNLKNYYLSNISNIYALSYKFFNLLIKSNKKNKIQKISKKFFLIIFKFFKKVFFKNIVFFLKKVDFSSINLKLKTLISFMFDSKSFESLRLNFINEFINVSVSTFLTKDPKFLMNWIIKSLNKISYRKQWKFIYNLKKNIIKISKKFIQYTKFTGIHIVIKGKIGALGSVRKKTFHIKYGKFGFSRFYLKGDELFSYCQTKTGKIGVKVVTAYS